MSDAEGQRKADPLKVRLVLGVVCTLFAVATWTLVDDNAIWLPLIVGVIGIWQLATAAIGYGVRDGQR